MHLGLKDKIAIVGGASMGIGYGIARTLAEEGVRVAREKLRYDLGGQTALMATLLNRQPTPEESDAFLKSGDGFALILASPAFQRC